MAGRDDVERTDDGRYLVIDGRRWRATDPLVPEARRHELQSVLMAWRRDVRRFRTDPLEPGLLRRRLDRADLAPSVGLANPAVDARGLADRAESKRIVTDLPRLARGGAYL